jgi:hypothetical protein
MTLFVLLLACTAGKDVPSGQESTALDTADTDAPTDSDSSPAPDADTDGYASTDDCDDTDADVHPGAEEVPGNGIDDCAGGDLPDGDRDGYGAADAGGDDCDNASAWVHPGAAEYCDGVDQDCDSETLPDGPCDGVQEPRAGARQVFTGAEFGRVFEDVTGDRLGDIAAAAPFNGGFEVDGETIGPAWAFYAAPDVERGPWVPPDGAAQVVTTAGRSDDVDGGDLTGDGIADLVFVSFGEMRIRVQPGPLPMDAAVLDVTDTATYWSFPASDPDTWCMTAALDGDFDGDEINDILCNSSALDGQGEIQFLRGGEFPAPHADATYLDTWAFTFVTLPDITGDGASQVALTDPHFAKLVVDGAELAAGGEVTDSTLATFTFQGQVAPTVDRTGDGLADLLVAADADFLGYEHGAVYVFDGGFRGDMSPEQATGCWVGTPEGFVSGVHDVDLDGDGAPEAMIDVTNLDTRDFEEAISPILLPTWAEPYSTWALQLGDSIVRGYPADRNVDGAAGDDFLFHMYADASEEGNEYLYPGWDVPWFDTRYWPQ